MVFLMTAKTWGLVALAGMIVLAWIFRYETIPVQANPTGYAYLVNRWTGTAYMMHRSTVREVEATPKLVEPEAGADPPSSPGLFDDVLPPKTPQGGGAPKVHDPFAADYKPPPGIDWSKARRIGPVEDVKPNPFDQFDGDAPER